MNWYYAEAGEQRGPITDAELSDLANAGTIRDGTLIWREGMASWQPYGQVKGSTGPPPPQKVGEVVCWQCGKMFSRDEVIPIGEGWVCAGCKPIYVQRLKEGAMVPGVLEYATFWTRLGAKVLDVIILWVMNSAIGFVVGLAAGTMPRSRGSVALQLIVIFISVVINLGYGIFFLGKFGATPGKMACKIKVVTPGGEPISYGRACGRCLSEILSGLICYVGYIMAAFDDEKRALHDRICETRVIKV